MIRALDFMFSFLGFIILLPVMLIVIIIGFFDTGAPLFFQKRLGRHQRTFTLIKIRTMHIKTSSVASHLVDRNQITAFGKFIRKYKIDELPQLLNVILGDLSLVGPRPCLPNQEELIKEREAYGIFNVKPGITGLGQINNVDMSDPVKLVFFEAKMIEGFNLYSYLFYIMQTAAGKGTGDAVH